MGKRSLGFGECEHTLTQTQVWRRKKSTQTALGGSAEQVPSGPGRTLCRLGYVSLQRAVPRPSGPCDRSAIHTAFVAPTSMPIPGWELKDREHTHWCPKGPRESHLSLGMGLETKGILPAKFPARFHKLPTCMESGPYGIELGGPGSWQRSWRNCSPDSSEPSGIVAGERMTSEVGPGLSRSRLHAMWGQGLILGYAHLPRPWLRKLGEPHLSEKTLPRLGCGYGPLGPDRPSICNGPHFL